MDESKLAAIIGAVTAYMQHEERAMMAKPRAAAQPMLSPWRLFHLQETMRMRIALRAKKNKHRDATRR